MIGPPPSGCQRRRRRGRRALVAAEVGLVLARLHQVSLSWVAHLREGRHFRQVGGHLGVVLRREARKLGGRRPRSSCRWPPPSALRKPSSAGTGMPALRPSSSTWLLQARVAARVLGAADAVTVHAGDVLFEQLLLRWRRRPSSSPCGRSPSCARSCPDTRMATSSSKNSCHLQLVLVLDVDVEGLLPHGVVDHARAPSRPSPTGTRRTRFISPAPA